LKNVCNKIVNGAHQLFGYPYFSKYLILCPAEVRNSYRLENLNKNLNYKLLKHLKYFLTFLNTCTIQIF